MDNNSNASDITLSLPAVQKTSDTTSANNPANNTSPIIPQPVTQPLQDANQVLAQPTNVPTEGASLVAEDVDLIEKEWVERAKDIVHKTKDNPHLQNKALTELKVDYIKKRYNKDIRTSD